jgi:hypothetical protein
VSTLNQYYFYDGFGGLNLRSSKVEQSI